MEAPKDQTLEDFIEDLKAQPKVQVSWDLDKIVASAESSFADNSNDPLCQSTASVSTGSTLPRSRR